MTTPAAETLADEYQRLSCERYELSKAARVDQRDSGVVDRLRAIAVRLREIESTPPDGYDLPKIAAGLVTHAEAHGWRVRVQWTPPGYEDEPYVTVQVGRRVTRADGYAGTGDRWAYALTWHSRGCQTGKARLFGSGVAVTPDHPAAHNAPSVKAIRGVITANPVQAEG